MPQLLLLPRKSISNGFTLSTKLFKIVFCLLIILPAALFSDSLSVHSAVSVTEIKQNEPLCLWQRSDAATSQPSWLLADQDGERGLTLFKEKLYIVSRSAGTSVRIVDAKTGTDDGTLAMDDLIKGGTYLLNDIESDSSGNILACNLAATPKSRNFKIYRWKNSTSKPELFISYDNPQKFRLGDHFSLFGNLETQADIFAAATGTDKIIHWVVKKGKASEPQIISLKGLTNCGSATYFAPLTDGSFLLNANSLTPQLFNDKLELSGSISDQLIPTGSTVFKQIVTPADTVFLFFLSKPAEKNGQSIRAIRWNGKKPAKLTNSDILFTTPPLGKNINSNFVGDIAFSVQKNSLDFYLLATNNGLAAYSYKLNEKNEIKPELPVLPEIVIAKPEVQIVDSPAIKDPVLPEIAADTLQKADILPPVLIEMPPDTLSMSAEIDLQPVIETSGSETFSVPDKVETPVLAQAESKPQIPEVLHLPAEKKEEPIPSPIREFNQPSQKEPLHTISFRSKNPQVAGFMVFNIRGDLVFNKQQFIMAGENSFTIPLKNWRRGVYPYKIILDDRIISGKAVNTK